MMKGKISFIFEELIRIYLKYFLKAQLQDVEDQSANTCEFFGDNRPKNNNFLEYFSRTHLRKNFDSLRKVFQGPKGP